MRGAAPGQLNEEYVCRLWAIFDQQSTRWWHNDRQQRARIPKETKKTIRETLEACLGEMTDIPSDVNEHVGKILKNGLFDMNKSPNDSDRIQQFFADGLHLETYVNWTRVAGWRNAFSHGRLPDAGSGFEIVRTTSQLDDDLARMVLMLLEIDAPYLNNARCMAHVTQPGLLAPVIVNDPPSDPPVTISPEDAGAFGTRTQDMVNTLIEDLLCELDNLGGREGFEEADVFTLHDEVQRRQHARNTPQPSVDNPPESHEIGEEYNGSEGKE
jgi:hypothetical protein